ncbi:uncharacterized protein RCH25_009251 [Pelodytes ibericus]
MSEMGTEACNDCGKRQIGDLIYHELYCYDVYIVSAPCPQNRKQTEVDDFMAENIVKPLENQGLICYHGTRNITGGQFVIQAIVSPITIIPTTIVPIFNDKAFAKFWNFIFRPDYLQRIVLLMFDSTKVPISKTSYSLSIKDVRLLPKLIQTIEKNRNQIPLLERKRKNEMMNDPESTINSNFSELCLQKLFMKSDTPDRLSNEMGSQTFSISSEDHASSCSDFPKIENEVHIPEFKFITSPEILLSHCCHNNTKISHSAARMLAKIIQKDIALFYKNKDLQRFEKEVRFLVEKEYAQRGEMSSAFEKLYFWILAATYIRIYKCCDRGLKAHIKSLKLKKCKSSQKPFDKLYQQSYHKLTVCMLARIKTWPNQLDKNDLHVQELENCMSSVDHTTFGTGVQRCDISKTVKYLKALPWDIKYIFVVLITEKIFEKKYTESGMRLFAEICNSVQKKHTEIFLDMVERVTEYIEENYTKGTSGACLKLLETILDSVKGRRKQGDQLITILKHYFKKLVYHPLIDVRILIAPLLFSEELNAIDIWQLGSKCVRVDADLVEQCICEKLTSTYPDLVLKDHVKTMASALVLEVSMPSGDALVHMLKQKTLNDILQTNSTDDVFVSFQETSKAVAKCQGHDNIVQLLNMSSNGIPPFYMVKHGKPLLCFLHEMENQLTWSHMMDILIDITNAVQHCHDNSVILRDITPASFEVFPGTNGLFQTKLSSFFFAKCTTLEGANKDPVKEYVEDIDFLCFQGDPKEPVAAYFSAPETLTNRTFSKYTEAWMLSATFYSILLYGRQPYQELAHLKLFQVVKEIISCHSPKIPNSFSPDLWNILKTNLNFAANKRMLIETLLQELESYRANLGAKKNMIYTVKSISAYIKPEDIQRGYLDLNVYRLMNESIYHSTEGRLFPQSPITEIPMHSNVSTTPSFLKTQGRYVAVHVGLKLHLTQVLSIVSCYFTYLHIHILMFEYCAQVHRPLRLMWIPNAKTPQRHKELKLKYLFIPEKKEEPTRRVYKDHYNRSEQLHQIVSVRMNLNTRKKIKALSHPNVLQVEEIVTGPYTTTLVYQPFGNYDRTLRNIDKNTGIIKLLHYFDQLTFAMQELLSHNILHCDLRCSHIYLNTEEETLKVSHFGRAVSLESQETNPYAFKMMPCEAERWSAPEVRVNGMYSHESDIYSLAMVFWEAFTTQNNTQYMSHSLESTSSYTRHMDTYTNLPSNPDRYCYSRLLDCMQKCWNPNPTKRPSLDYIRKTIKELQRNYEGYRSVFNNASMSKHQATLKLPLWRTSDCSPERNYVLHWKSSAIQEMAMPCCGREPQKRLISTSRDKDKERPKKPVGIGAFYSPKTPIVSQETSTKMHTNSSAESSPLDCSAMTTITQDTLNSALDSLYEKIKSDSDKNRADIKSDITDLHVTLSHQSAQIGRMQEGFKQMQLQNASLNKDILALKQKVTDIEDRSRRRNLKLRGIPESVRNIDLEDYLIDFLKVYLDPGIIGPLPFERVHRLPRPLNLSQEIPRDTIACFHNAKLKDLLMKQARINPTQDCRFSSISLYADISQATRIQRSEFKSLTAILRDKAIEYRWGFPTKLIISFQGKRFTCENYSQARELMQEWIDYFLLRGISLEGCLGTKIGNISWSDHAPLFLDFKDNIEYKVRPRWHLNDSILASESSKINLRTEALEFLRNNDKNDVNELTLLCSLKCYLRGILIKMGASLNKLAGKTLLDLYIELFKLETLNKVTPNQITSVAIKDTQKLIKIKLEDQFKRTVTRLKVSWYINDGRPGRALTNRMKHRNQHSRIKKILSEGRTCLSPRDISNAFKQYYNSLYNLPTPTKSVSQVREFLRSLNLPKISQEKLLQLNKPILDSELALAINTIKKGKVPGPDGLSSIFYHTLRWFLESNPLVESSLLDKLVHSAGTTKIISKLQVLLDNLSTQDKIDHFRHWEGDLGKIFRWRFGLQHARVLEQHYMGFPYKNNFTKLFIDGIWNLNMIDSPGFSVSQSSINQEQEIYNLYDTKRVDAEVPYFSVDNAWDSILYELVSSQGIVQNHTRFMDFKETPIYHDVGITRNKTKRNKAIIL